VNHRDWIALWDKAEREAGTDESRGFFRSLRKSSLLEAERRAWQELRSPGPSEREKGLARARARYDRSLAAFRAVEAEYDRAPDDQPEHAAAALLSLEAAREGLEEVTRDVEAELGRRLSFEERSRGFSGGAGPAGVPGGG